MGTTSENYFNLPNPEELHCYVHSLGNSHPVMILHIKQGKGKPDLRVSFIVPIYFEGPMDWKGAKFVVGSTEELLEFWQSIWKGKVSEEVFLRNYQLFKAKIETDTTEVKQVKVIASRAEILEEKE